MKHNRWQKLVVKLEAMKNRVLHSYDCVAAIPDQLAQALWLKLLQSGGKGIFSPAFTALITESKTNDKLSSILKSNCSSPSEQGQTTSQITERNARNTILYFPEEGEIDFIIDNHYPQHFQTGFNHEMGQFFHQLNAEAWIHDALRGCLQSG